jgi:hypothetical protein
MKANKKHAIGYIVSCSKLGPMRVNRFGPTRLYAGSEATLFSSKAQIKTAIENTENELKAGGYGVTVAESYGRLTIHRVKRPQQRITKVRR